MIEAKAPTWAITAANLAEPNDPSNVDYALSFNGVAAGLLTVQYTYDGCTSTVVFNREHEGNDGALITYLALRALYDNYAEQNLRTDGGFEFACEAFEFLGRPLEFTY